MRTITKICALVVALFITSQNLRAQEEKPAYTIYDAEGRPVTYGEMIRQLSKPDAVFLGEMHNCPVTHWLEFEIVRSLHAVHGDSLVIGEEMLESDNQLIIDEFLQGKISENRFETETRLWDNYKTDYKPVTIFAKARGLRLVATNIPRRYANAVNAGGLQALDGFSDEAKRYMAPLPIKFTYDEAANREKFQQMIQMTGGRINIEYIAQAQAVKDATMAWFIAKNLRGKLVHLNGSAHSDRKEGIIPYLLDYRPGTKVGTVSFVRQQDISRLDEANKGMADFIICIPTTMMVTY